MVIQILFNLRKANSLGLHHRPPSLVERMCFCSTDASQALRRSSSSLLDNSDSTNQTERFANEWCGNGKGRLGVSKGSMGHSKGVMTGDSLRPVIVTCVHKTENRANLASNCRNGTGIAETGWEVGDLSWGRFGS
jgi:hypothetical protein